MPPLKRPDIEIFVPESAVIATGSHSGVFALALEQLKAKAGGRRLVMAGHETSNDLFGYIVYGWVNNSSNIEPIEAVSNDSMR